VARSGFAAGAHPSPLRGGLRHPTKLTARAQIGTRGLPRSRSIPAHQCEERPPKGGWRPLLGAPILESMAAWSPDVKPTNSPRSPRAGTYGIGITRRIRQSLKTRAPRRTTSASDASLQRMAPSWRLTSSLITKGRAGNPSETQIHTRPRREALLVSVENPGV
jgi:hypothetical protein